MVMIDMVDVIEDEDRCVLRYYSFARASSNLVSSAIPMNLSLVIGSLLIPVLYWRSSSTFSMPVTVEKCIEAGNGRPRIEEFMHKTILSH